MFTGKKRGVTATYVDPFYDEDIEMNATILTAEKGVEPDMINQPPHYTVGGIETIDFIEAKGLNYNLGQVVKYVSRAQYKDGYIEDLKKAQFYLNREIEICERNMKKALS